jgi:hypothetical protein
MNKPRGKGFQKGFDPRRQVGRKKQGETLAQQIRDALSDPLIEGTDYSKLDGILDALTEKALDGDVPATEYLLARGWGKIPDRLQIGIQQKVDFSRLTTEEYQIYKALFMKMVKEDDAQRAERDDIVDGKLLN